MPISAAVTCQRPAIFSDKKTEPYVKIAVLMKSVVRSWRAKNYKTLFRISNMIAVILSALPEFTLKAIPNFQEYKMVRQFNGDNKSKRHACMIAASTDFS